jgi:hypothetical protein
LVYSPGCYRLRCHRENGRKRHWIVGSETTTSSASLLKGTMHGCVLKGKTFPATPVRDIMETHVVIARPEQSVDRSVALMSEKRVRHPRTARPWLSRSTPRSPSSPYQHHSTHSRSSLRWLRTLQINMRSTLQIGLAKYLNFEGGRSGRGRELRHDTRRARSPLSGHHRRGGTGAMRSYRHGPRTAGVEYLRSCWVAKQSKC